MTTDTLTLEEFTSRLSSLISSEPSLRNVWVTAETSDVRRAMHCYLELIQKKSGHRRTDSTCACHNLAFGTRSYRK